MQVRKRAKSLSSTRRLVLSAVFAALAYAVMSVFRFNVQFLTFDLKDAVITVAGLLLGPGAALSISVLVAVLEQITVGDTGFYGFMMNMASSATFSVVASVVYKYRKRLSGAIVGLCSAVAALVAVMSVLNLLVTPHYLGVSTGEVAALIPALLLPFNAVKALSNASLVLVFYKPISRAMVAAGLLPKKGTTSPSDAQPLPEGQAAPHGQTTGGKRHLWVSIAVSAAGVVLFLAAVLFVLFVLDGQTEWF